MKRLASVIIILATLIPSSYATDRVTITFDKIPRQETDTLTIKGVTFQFQGASSILPLARFGENMAGETKLMTVPYVQAATSRTLTMQFPRPTSYLSFSLGLAGGGPQTPGYRVGLFSGGASIGSIPVNTQMGGTGPFSFSEGKFKYDDPNNPLSSVLVTINQPAVADVYVVDNVVFVPEPTALPLVIAGVAALAGCVAAKEAQSPAGSITQKSGLDFNPLP